MTKRNKWWFVIAFLTCLVVLGVLIYKILSTPDGQIAYETFGYRVCLVEGIRTRCEIQRLDPDTPILPADSSFLDFYERDGLMEIHGKESILLTEAAFVPYLFPRWAPDNNAIVYSNREHTSICFADATGGNEWCFDTELSWVGEFSWSPNGKQIALVAAEMPDVFELHIYIFDLEDRSLNSVLTNAEYPAWSPDGQQIAFTSSRDGNNEIYVIDIDGSNLRRITNDPANDFAPAWSPDGEQIAFLSDRGEDRLLLALETHIKLRIYVVDADGGRVQRLISRPFDSIERFRWGE